MHSNTKEFDEVGLSFKHNPMAYYASGFRWYSSTTTSLGRASGSWSPEATSSSVPDIQCSLPVMSVDAKTPSFQTCSQSSHYESQLALEPTLAYLPGRQEILLLLQLLLSLYLMLAPLAM